MTGAAAIVVLAGALLAVPSGNAALARAEVLRVDAAGTREERASAVRRRRPMAWSRTAGRAGDGDDPVHVARTLDLLAACLVGGMGMAPALGAVAPLAPPALAEGLTRVADLLALGAPPEAAWSEVERLPGLAELARTARRSARSGSPPAPAITELATETRESAQHARTARTERAGVVIAGPLGLCFVPAFVVLGMLPVVIGLAGPILAGLGR